MLQLQSKDEAFECGCDIAIKKGFGTMNSNIKRDFRLSKRKGKGTIEY